MPRLILALALVCTAGCKKKAPEVVDPTGPVASVDEPIQVVLVTPGAIPANTATPIQVVGTGFAEGAAVRIGASELADVAFDNGNQLSLTTPALPDGRYNVTVRNPDGGSATLYAGLIVGSGQEGVTGTRNRCATVTVYFPLDSAGLDEAAKATLAEESGCYATWSGRIEVGGHADERGTTDYNIALGQRRAEAVRLQLSKQGVLLANLRAVSYGEEHPAEMASTEEAWAKNRRVVVRPEQ